MRNDLAALLAGDADAALERVVAVAQEARTKQALDMASIGSTLGGLKDQAMPVLSDLGGRAGSMASSVWANPHARAAIIGAGIGAGSDLLMDNFVRKEKKRKGTLRSILEGGALGAGVGGGGSLLAANVPMLGPAEKAGAAPAWLGSLGNTASSVGGQALGAVKDFGGKAVGLAKDVWANPHARAGIIGGGVGLGAGALVSALDKRRRKRWLSNALTGGLLGAAVGGGGSLAHKQLFGGGLGKDAVPGSPGVGGGQGAGPKGPPLGVAARAAGKAQEGYNTLARLGYNDEGVQQAAADVRGGDTSTDQAVSRIRKEGPRGIAGGISQLGGVAPGVGGALQTGDVEGAAAHADILGLKSLNPASENAAVLPVSAAIAGHVAARSLTPGGKLSKGLSGGIDALARPGSAVSTPLGKLPGLPFRDELRNWATGRQDKLLEKELDIHNKALVGGKTPQSLGEAFGKKTPDELPKPTPEPQPIPTGNQLQDRQEMAAYKNRVSAQNAAHDAEVHRRGEAAKGPSREVQIRNARLARAKRHAPTSTLGKMTGGWPGLLAAAAPLAAWEWGPGGYRSGTQPAMNIAEANKVLGGQ